MNRCPKIEYGRLSGEIGWHRRKFAHPFSKQDHSRRRVPAIDDRAVRRSLVNGPDFRQTGALIDFIAISPIAASPLPETKPARTDA